MEGEGALHLTVEGDRVIDLRLEIYEPPRMFESFSRGRAAAELPDLLARICGICPVAYQMSAVHAVENAHDVSVHPQIRALRRLYYAGEWMESHLLHMMFLAAPDYLGLQDGIQVARHHRAEVERSLRLRKLGNRILILFGGRSVNPVGVRIGGFHRIPTRDELDELGGEIRAAMGEAEALLAWFKSLRVPRRPLDLEVVALRHEDEYPMNEGRIESSLGLDVGVEEFDETFEESQVPHSTALHCRIGERGPYLVGPLARLLLNSDQLSGVAAGAFDDLRDRFATPDPASSVFARGIEVLQAMEVALQVIEGFVPPPAAAAPWEPREATGHAATEAPRGLLYISVSTDDAGDVSSIRIVPPTSQNQAQIESDLRALAPEVLSLAHEEAQQRLEAAIRDYDPCISCSTHFLTLEIERQEE